MKLKINNMILIYSAVNPLINSVIIFDLSNIKMMKVIGSC